MKKKRNLYIVAFLCFITLVGVTIAYLQSTNTFENIFNAGTYKTITHEEFTSPTNWTPGDETPKTITTKNEGTIPVRVRVKLEEEWTSKNGNPLDLIYNNENAAIINLDNEVDWIYKDGYYYYTKELAPGETTSSLIESVTFNPNVEGDVDCTTENGTVTCESTGNSYDGGTYKLKITTETVQAKNYEEIWENVPIMYDYVGDNPCTYEGELVPGAEYVNGQYTYRYRQEGSDSPSSLKNDWMNISNDGWGVILTDKDSTIHVDTVLCSSINNKPVVSMQGMFRYTEATSIDVSSFDTSNITNMSHMFYKSKITNLNLSLFDTKKVTSMKSMFYLSSVTNLDISSFDTSNVTNMYGMFGGIQVNTLDLSNFNTSNVTDMRSMFAGTTTPTLDLTNFNTSKVTEMRQMFAENTTPILDLSSFDTSNVTDMALMFWKNESTSIILSSFDTSKVTNMNAMFSQSKVNVIDLSSFEINDGVNLTSMFSGATATTGYARTQADADKFNSSSNKPSTLTFVVKES